MEAPDSLSRPQALRKIKSIVGGNGKVVPRKHLKKRLKERRLTMQDVLYVLKSGAIYDEPELDIRTNNWKYKVEGITIDEKPIKVPVVIIGDSIFLLTVLIGRKRG